MIGGGKLLSIRSRVLLLSLVPMLTLAAILGTYFTYSRLADNTIKLQERGQLLVGLLASAAEFGVISGNRYQLRILSQKTRQSHPEVRDILFYDANFNMLYRSDDFAVELNPASPPSQQDGDNWLFFSPITSSALLLEHNPELMFDVLQPSQTGWVAVALSSESTSSARRDMLFSSLLLITAGLLVTAIVAGRFGLRITRPIQALSQVIERLEDGQLDTRAATPHASGELGLLARGINRMATRIQASNREQAEQISKATRQLTTTLRHLERQNEELSLARRQADGANHAKDEFLARMSHELRTPLTSVLGFSKLLQRTQQTPEQQQYCQIIDQTSTLLLTIIDDILDFSRLQSDAIELEQLEFSPRQCLLNLLEMQAPMAQHKGLTLIEELSSELPPALIGDPTRISQILTNLLSNAIKFTDAGEVRLSARVVRAGRHCKLILSVSDTGIGISPERQRHLFQAFSQADNTISRRFGGSGLGLVIAHRLTQMMGGTLELESQAGIGTRVGLTLTLPLAHSTSVPATNTPEVYSSAFTLSCPLKVLLAEDNDFNRLLIYKVLTQAGAQVITATTGTLALGAFEREQPDLVLMDVHMPQMDGIQATRAIRQQDTGTPIVALTASVMPHEHQALKQAGANAVMLKPIKLPELFAQLDHLCRDRGYCTSGQPPENTLAAEVDPQTLHLELERQLDALCPAVEAGQLEVVRSHAHQLLGLAGLYQLPELEAVVAELHQAAVAGDIPRCWRRCFRLRRLIEHHQYQ